MLAAFTRGIVVTGGSGGRNARYGSVARGATDRAGERENETQEAEEGFHIWAHGAWVTSRMSGTEPVALTPLIDCGGWLILTIE